MFNFSDAKASHRKAPFTFHPFVTSDLRIFGDAKHPEKTKVVFLAIHLAPQGSLTETNPKGRQSPYQAKWFDNADISYKLHADKVVPANIQDLQSLLTLVTGAAVPEENKPLEATSSSIAFQGRYGAGLVTNLKELPVKVTSSMTATFSGPPDQAKASAYCSPVNKNLVPSTGNRPKGCADSSVSAKDVLPQSIAPPSAVPTVSGNSDPSKSPAAAWLITSQAPQLVLLDYKLNLTSEPQEEESASAPASRKDKTKPVSPKNPKTAKPSGSQNKTASKATTAPPGNCDSSTTTDPATKSTTQKPCILTQTIIDEGLYHWDVSIAVPTPGYKESVFDSNNALMPKSVTRTNAYAMLDIAPWGEDFVKPQLFGIPHLMTGLPLAGKVFDKPFVGGFGEEVGLTKLLPFSARLFGGVVYNKEFRGAEQQPHRVWKVQYGIELSMSSAISKLKGKTATKSNATGSGN